MRDDVRAYGDFHGLNPENFEKIRDSIPFPQTEYVDNVLHVDHEGGYLMIDPIFRALGAGENTLPLIEQYMWIWLIGSFFTFLPMFGNGILIAAGDARTASRIS